MDWWLPEAGALGRRGAAATAGEVSFRGDENVLELDGGVGHTTLNSLRSTELYTLNGDFYDM